MGGKIRHANSPAVAPPLCCMCGDSGIEEELFRCRNCSTRLQHRYCSNLYPKVDRYLSCNWCLEEEAVVKLQEPGVSASCSSGGGFVGVKLRRRALASLADEPPIKKPRLPPHRRTATVSSPDAAERSGSKTIATELGRAKPAVCRVRVRRYKLLEEVYSPAKLLDLQAALYT